MGLPRLTGATEQCDPNEPLSRFQLGGRQQLHQQMPSCWVILIVRHGLFRPVSLLPPAAVSLIPLSLSFHRLSPSTVPLLPPSLSFHRLFPSAVSLLPPALVSLFPLPTSLVYFSRTLDMPLCSWCTDLPRPPHYLSRKTITLHKLAWEYRHGWREVDPNTSPDTAVAIPEGPDADTRTSTTNSMDIDAGEDEGLPRVGKFIRRLLNLLLTLPQLRNQRKSSPFSSSFANGWILALPASNTGNFKTSFGSSEGSNYPIPAAEMRSFNDLLDLPLYSLTAVPTIVWHSLDRTQS